MICTYCLAVQSINVFAYEGVPKSTEVIDVYDDFFSYDEETLEYQEIFEDWDSFGDVGRFYIPSVGVDVAVYYVPMGGNSGWAQSVTDAEDSAVMQNFSASAPYIADHWNQGFLAIKDCQVGDRAYLKHQDGTIEEYECKGVFTGHNLEYDLVLDDGTSLDNVAMDLYCYTCNGNWQNIYITIFDRV